MSDQQPQPQQHKGAAGSTRPRLRVREQLYDVTHKVKLVANTDTDIYKGWVIGGKSALSR